MKPHTYTIGIDEVGRGPLAGPVTVCAFMIPVAHYAHVRKFSKGIKDSKKLSAEKREAWVRKIAVLVKEKKVAYKIVCMSSAVIDKMGIAVAIKMALAKALRALKTSPKNSKILLDGSLYAPAEFENQKTIIKGDEKEFIISLASIVAKVYRDNLMATMAKKHRGYGFEVHKGYGTLSHRQAIKRLGPSPIHRRSYMKNLAF